MNLTWYRNDKFPLRLEVKDEDGNPINLLGSTVFFTVKENPWDDDSQALIQKVVTEHFSPTQGITYINFDEGETDLGQDNYFYDVQILDISSTIQTIMRGYFIIKSDVTKRNI